MTGAGEDAAGGRVRETSGGRVPEPEGKPAGDPAAGVAGGEAVDGVGEAAGAAGGPEVGPAGGPVRRPGEPRLLVVGAANADLLARVARRPAPGETVLAAPDLAVHPGGKGANQAVAAARLGAAVAFCGAVGRDPYGDLLARALRDAGVDTDALAFEEGTATGVALITVTPDGENAIVVVPGANARLTPDRARAAVTPGVRVVSAQCEVPLDAVLAAARRAPRLVLNASPAETLAAAPEASELLALADPLVVNEHEMRVLLGPRGGGPADLLRRGPRSAVVTLGAAGAVVVEPGAPPVTVPAPAVEVVDTTGAGDAFTGALAWRLAAGSSLPAATRIAVRTASAATRHRGAQP